MSDHTAENLAYFNKIANEYDQRHGSTIEQMERLVHARRDFIGIKQGDRLLDYACGTGMVSRALAQDVGECIGIDLSENMVGAYNAKAKTQGATRTAFQGNLADPTDPKPPALADAKFFNFDAAGVGFGWHHFENCELVAQRLAQRLKTGGKLFIIDFVPHELDMEAAQGRGVKHDGFSEDQMRVLFSDAGVGKDFEYEVLPEPINFPGVHGSDKGHSHGEGHDHAHKHDHKHEHGDGSGHGHGHKHGGLAGRTMRVFIARGSKL